MRKGSDAGGQGIPGCANGRIEEISFKHKAGQFSLEELWDFVF